MIIKELLTIKQQLRTAIDGHVKEIEEKYGVQIEYIKFRSGSLPNGNKIDQGFRIKLKYDNNYFVSTYHKHIYL